MKTGKQTKGIGFKNFRRFLDFPMLKFGDITYLVGRNNSGKSTMVKAQLLMMDYLKEQLHNSFSFDSAVLEDANIVTFGRAKNNKSESNQIEFTLSLNNIYFTVVISGKDNSTKANVLSFDVEDKVEGISLTVDYTNKNINLKRTQKNVDSNKRDLVHTLVELTGDLQDIEEEISKLPSKASKEYLTLNDKRNSLKKQIDKIDASIPIKTEDESYDYNVNYPLQFLRVGQMYDVEEEDEDEYNVVLSEDTMIQEFIAIVLHFNEIEYKKDIEKSKNNTDSEFNPDSIEVYQNGSKLRRWAEKVSNLINSQDFQYIPANPSKQSALFALRDKNNDLAQAIHHFKQAGLDDKPESKKFVKYWMKEFEVGEDFSIEFYAGEAYEFHISEDGAQNHLSDKGMGSLQIMSLILKLATILFDKKNENKNVPTVLIEEPELNLHPGLQSKLCDLFLSVSKNNINFLVETHSEYLIRKSQALVKKLEFDENDELNTNPFKVYYFPKEKGDLPYQMIYRKDGKFSNEFRPGFFDISSDLAFDIL